MGERGTHFDPDVIDAFYRIGDTIKYISHELTEDTVNDVFVLEDVLDPMKRSSFYLEETV